MSQEQQPEKSEQEKVVPQGESNQSNAGTTESDDTQTASVSPVTPAIAWYARPWIWALLLLFMGILLFAWLFWQSMQQQLAIQEAERAAEEARQRALIEAQKNKNAQLQSEADRLRALLAQDPCIIKEFLLGSGAVLPSSPLKGEDAYTPEPNTSPNTSPGTTPNVVPNNPPSAEQNTPPATEAEAPPPPPLPNSDSAEPPSVDASAIAQKLEYATVLILVSDNRGNVTSGTGFFIAPGIIFTNRHVVQNKNSTIYVIGKFQGTATEAQAIAISNVKSEDFAVLKTNITNLEPLSFALDVVRTQRVSAWGFPGAITGDDPKFQSLLEGHASAPPEVVYSEGSVSVIQEQNPPLIFHTAVVSQGNSGGPLVNARGEVVGVNTYIRMDDESYRQSNLAIISSAIVKFLQEHKVPFTVAPAPSKTEPEKSQPNANQGEK